MNFPFDEQNLNSTSDCIFISCHFLAEVTFKYFPKFTRKYLYQRVFLNVTSARKHFTPYYSL